MAIDGLVTHGDTPWRYGPSTSPRIVSMIGVNGWYRAKSPSTGRHGVSRHERRADVGDEHQHHGERGRRLGAAGQ